MSDNKRMILTALGAGAIIGAFIGLGLSFTALSPLVMGGIVAAVPMILLFVNGEFNKAKKGTPSEQNFFLGICFCVASAAVGVGVGVGLAAAAMAIFPGATLGMGSAALAGAAIGMIAPIVGICASIALLAAVNKVNSCIISPIIEHFSPKEQKIQ